MGFFFLVSFLLYKTISGLKWSDFLAAFGELSFSAILICLVLVALNFLILSSFDYFGFRHLQNRFLSYPKIALSAFLCYVFNLNLGALVGGVGFRFRIYTGWGVAPGMVPKIVLFSSMTNWLGHTALLGLLLCFKAPQVASLFNLSELPFVLYGWVSLGVVLLYFVASARGFVLNVKGISFPFPRLRLAFLQIFLSFSQWTIISVIIYLLLTFIGAKVEWPEVLFTTLVASIAGMFTHIPAGLGVLEVIFLRMNLEASDAQILAALLCYRAIYYILPLLIALPVYLWVEKTQKSRT